MTAAAELGFTERVRFATGSQGVCCVIGEQDRAGLVDASSPSSSVCIVVQPYIPGRSPQPRRAPPAPPCESPPPAASLCPGSPPRRRTPWNRHSAYAGRPNLASAVLSRVLGRLSSDYLAVYGHRVLAVETFTDPARHTGACYAAANFAQLGSSLGYSRSAGAYHHHGHPKRVWMYRLHRDAGRILSATFPHPLLTGRHDAVADVNTLDLAGAGCWRRYASSVTRAASGVSATRSRRS